MEVCPTWASGRSGEVPFDIKNFLNDASRREVVNDFPIRRISVKKLHPSDRNFYEISPEEVEALKDTIELVGIQENLVVREIAEGELAGEYEIIAGHKRHLAVSELAREGRASEFVPCRVDDSGDGILRELILIFTNSTQRERSDYEKMNEVQRVRELLEGYSSDDLPGRKRDIIAGILNTSKSKISRLDNIRRNMMPEFMEEYKAGKISTAAANEIAGASDEAQRMLWQQYKETGVIRGREAAVARKGGKPMPEDKGEEETGRIGDKGALEQKDEPREPPKKSNPKEIAEPEPTPELMEKIKGWEKEGQGCDVRMEGVAYWGKETARELARFAMWLTEEELAVMQDIALRLKERASRGQQSHRERRGG